MENLRETFHDHPIYTLSEIAMSLHRVVEKTYPQPYFIKAEILKLNFYPHSGHCYPELVEKEGNVIKAEMRAIIWATNYQRINQRFLQITGDPLKENINILCLASIEYSPKHGLALHIQDIEPTYTLGEMVKNRNAVIERLKKEGAFTYNKNLKMPMLPKRIAVISVETSKGYSDFITTLQGNRQGYCFETELFPSILQGDKAIVGITGRLAEIEMRQAEFDCVVIVRGGGGDVGLSCYDDYQLAQRVATFPLPVLTGIGHSTNLSVTDMVAYSYNITPTDVAFSLIQYFQTFDEKLMDFQTRLIERGRMILADEKNKLLDLETTRKVAVPKILTKHRQQLTMLSQRVALKSKEIVFSQNNELSKLRNDIERWGIQHLQNEREQIARLSQVLSLNSLSFLKVQQEKISNLEDKVTLLHPDNILKRGFSITRLNGKAVTNAEELQSGDELTTVVYQGTVTSVVK